MKTDLASWRAVALSERLLRTPAILYWFILGLAGLVVLGFVPSEVTTRYDIAGALVAIVLLVGLFRGSNVCRWLLIVLGLYLSAANLLMLTFPPEGVALTWAALVLFLTGLLLTPAMQRHTRHRL